MACRSRRWTAGWRSGPRARTSTGRFQSTPGAGPPTAAARCGSAPTRWRWPGRCTRTGRSRSASGRWRWSWTGATPAAPPWSTGSARPGRATTRGSWGATTRSVSRPWSATRWPPAERAGPETGTRAGMPEWIAVGVGEALYCPAPRNAGAAMKADIHPKYSEVVFQDVTSDFKILTRSTLGASSKETIKWEDGNEYPLVKIEVSSASHPFYTGQNKIMDTSGRVDKFRKRYAK